MYFGAEYRRIDYEVEELEKQIVADENALEELRMLTWLKKQPITQKILKMKLASKYRPMCPK